jgi:hypothetical protein
VQSVIDSPIFQSSHYVLTNDDAQYGSAFMRAQFNTFNGYGVNLGQPTVLATQTINVPQNQGQALFLAPDNSVVGVVQVRAVTDDVAVVAYKVKEQLTVEGKPLTFEAADASTWVRRDGRWMCALHTEAIIGDPFGRDRQGATKS